MLNLQEKTKWDGKMNINKAVGTALLGLALYTSPTYALGVNAEQPNLEKAANAKVYGKSLPPVGYVQFCARGEEECLQKGGNSGPIAMTPENWNMLNQVNTYVNGKIKPQSDIDFYQVAEMWTYPTTAGDCEDYVLLKKRYLQGMGFAAENLLITVLLDEKNEGHAVLTVTSDGGDFILDNRREEIMRWDETSYKFLKRQSQADPKQWVSLQKSGTQIQLSSKSN